ncbi:hypothetical protein TVAG_321180 [Trichomonas vaginalis G3]|uniref:Uncharacterized protein n=1 Tax=Trichomonas vaginalis (strain ATCC PRA-98 / G3) TaxID=412133 RepID=A2F826_TRIV3|nr:hypothetical protein TVAGG3_0383590 [Trichomonas vaginalis G3]EAX98958.1 hypothetical protein TVAG_321180 [Trichomonas vaginalis G3]KAI5533461.1 hypothetical protein TVAGG3_0383590 [Trichomonas vaginalis G3]|eukprot:XP_001311888.1 hypothetical protein [Trichomonas vaginalis G3]
MFQFLCLLSQAKSYDENHHAKKVGKYLYPIASTNDDFPFILLKKDIQKLERDYSTTDLNSIVDQISNEFELERDRVQNHFTRSKWASYSKQLFSRINFDLNNNGFRVVSLGGTVMKITKNNGVYNVNCRKASISTMLLHKAFRMRMIADGKTPEDYIVKTFQALPGQLISDIYNKLNSEIEVAINTYKSI